MQAIDLLNDIPMSTAVSAHSGTSFSPEKRGASERASYAETLASDYAALSKWATTPEKQAILDEEFARYRAGYRSKTLAHLGSKSRCVSTMIAGPSNFNVRRANKANEVERKRVEDVIGYRERALRAIEKALRPELRPIMTGDADAQDRLRVKLAKLEDMQMKFKAVNAAIRKHKKAGPDAQVAALVALGFNISEAHAKELLKPDSCGRIGFADYELTNNGANIRRLKAQLETVTVNQAKEATEFKGAEATVEDCPAENRVRLHFPGKPAAEVRERLKSSGFRWAPSLGVWQAYRHPHTMSIALQVAGVQAPEGAERKE